jgi:hypothetical protein
MEPRSYDELKAMTTAYAALREPLDANRDAHALVVGAASSPYFKCPRCGAGREFLKWTCCQDRGEMTLQAALSMLEVQIKEEMNKFSELMRSSRDN